MLIKITMKNNNNDNNKNNNNNKKNKKTLENELLHFELICL